MNVLIVGATSGIGLELARLHARRGDTLCLVARDGEELARVAADCTIRGATAPHTFATDMGDMKAVTALAPAVEKAAGLPDRLYLCAALSGDYPDVLTPPDQVEALFRVNCAGPVALVNGWLPALCKRGRGEIVGLSSVAALKGKGNNPVYSATKAALDIYLEGLRNGFSVRGLEVLTVYPGFTDTGLTFGMEGLMFLQSPVAAAADIARAADRKKSHLYTPRPWWFIMMILKHLPTFIYRKKPFLSEEEYKKITR